VAISGGSLIGYNPVTGKNSAGGFGQPQFSSQSGNREIQYSLKLYY